MRTQAIRGAVVLNGIPFGRHLRRFARDQAGRFSGLTGFGFQDGGCLMFAVALRDWSDGALGIAAVYRPGRGTQAQHVVAAAMCDEPLYLDSDGAGTAEDLLAKMGRFEMMSDGYIGSYSAAVERVIPFDRGLAADLASRMARRFGSFHPGLLSPFASAAEPEPGRPPAP